MPLGDEEDAAAPAQDASDDDSGSSSDFTISSVSSQGLEVVSSSGSSGSDVGTFHAAKLRAAGKGYKSQAEAEAEAEVKATPTDYTAEIRKAESTAVHSKRALAAVANAASVGSMSSSGSASASAPEVESLGVVRDRIQQMAQQKLRSAVLPAAQSTSSHEQRMAEMKAQLQQMQEMHDKQMQLMQAAKQQQEEEEDDYEAEPAMLGTVGRVAVVDKLGRPLEKKQEAKEEGKEGEGQEQGQIKQASKWNLHVGDSDSESEDDTFS